MPREITVPNYTQMADTTMVGNPLPLQDPYRRAQEQYPLRPTLPRYTVPLEEEIATNEIVQRNMQRDIGMRGALLNQEVTRKQLEYDNSITSQAGSAIPEVVNLDPASPDYQVQRAALIKQYPLAAQNPAFNSMLSRLDQTYSQQQQNDAVLFRDEQKVAAEEDMYLKRLNDSFNARAAALGEQAFGVYEKELATTNDPYTAFAKAATQAAADQAAAKDASLQDRPMTPQQVQREISSKRAQRLAILRQAGAESPSELTGDLADDYNAISQEIVALQSNPSAGAATGAPVKTMPIQSLFPKPSSTKSGP